MDVAHLKEGSSNKYTVYQIVKKTVKIQPVPSRYFGIIILQLLNVIFPVCVCWLKKVLIVQYQLCEHFLTYNKQDKMVKKGKQEKGRKWKRGPEMGVVQRKGKCVFWCWTLQPQLN